MSPSNNSVGSPWGHISSPSFLQGRSVRKRRLRIALPILHIYAQHPFGYQGNENYQRLNFCLVDLGVEWFWRGGAGCEYLSTPRNQQNNIIKMGYWVDLVHD